jgi:hypothetical protein
MVKATVKQKGGRRPRLKSMKEMRRDATKTAKATTRRLMGRKKK